MKKSEMEKLEKLNEQKKLTKEVKDKIIKKVFNNFLIAADIILYFIILVIAARNIEENITIMIYKISSMVFLVLTLVIFEISYKKDNDEMALHGIELLIVSIVTLLTPYIFLKRTKIVTSFVGGYTAAYYILKNLIIYRKEKSKFLRDQSDIPQIILKESKDEKAQEEKQKQKQEQEQANKTAEAPKKKRGRPKKSLAK